MTDDRDIASIVCTLLRQVRLLCSTCTGTYIIKVPNSYRKTPAKDPGATSHQKLAPASSPAVATEATAVHSPLQEGAGFRHDHIEAPGGWTTDIQCTAQTLAPSPSLSCLSAWAVGMLSVSEQYWPSSKSSSCESSIGVWLLSAVTTPALSSRHVWLVHHQHAQPLPDWTSWREDYDDIRTPSLYQRSPSTLFIQKLE
ncbi:hypothetical protein CPAR01_14953 [Colletotrichum paranaense]|uniref:Uncharacterized protein n=1 Tax=Colletotrichum paranaense TaxID=1914294 RepID=A0ABQ9S0E5_9PEZI|nr:uncharacterized protein CPAR01_14953 [Colletotrichum paranaense]KAK1521430.1 hypothetical protein CPAR01_14953 [Colletotrichum paranaense]